MSYVIYKHHHMSNQNYSSLLLKYQISKKKYISLKIYFFNVRKQNRKPAQVNKFNTYATHVNISKDYVFQNKIEINIK